MTLADTSVWIHHFRHGDRSLAEALQAGGIAMHPVVLGELATGNLVDRTRTLANLRRLPMAKGGSLEECLRFIELHRIHGRGIGWSDVQLLVAARLSGLVLWTRDRRLGETAAELGMSFPA